jgi:hypothetical protein
MPRGGTAEELIATSRAAALGDLDNDGNIDIVVVNKDARPHLLRNIAPQRGGWIMFRTLNRRGSYALGAVLRIDVGQKTRWRLVYPSSGYCASNDPRVHLGLGDTERVDAVTVHWPEGEKESFGPFAAGKTYDLRRGKGK